MNSRARQEKSQEEITNNVNEILRKYVLLTEKEEKNKMVSKRSSEYITGLLSSHPLPPTKRAPKRRLEEELSTSSSVHEVLKPSPLTSSQLVNRLPSSQKVPAFQPQSSVECLRDLLFSTSPISPQPATSLSSPSSACSSSSNPESYNSLSATGCAPSTSRMDSATAPTVSSEDPFHCSEFRGLRKVPSSKPGRQDVMEPMELTSMPVSQLPVLPPDEERIRKEGLKHGPIIKLDKNCPGVGREAIMSYFFYKNRYAAVKTHGVFIEIQKSERAGRGKRARQTPDEDATHVHRLFLQKKILFPLILKGKKLDWIEMEKQERRMRMGLKPKPMAWKVREAASEEEYNQAQVHVEGRDSPAPSPPRRSPISDPPQKESLLTSSRPIRNCRRLEILTPKPSTMKRVETKKTNKVATETVMKEESNLSEKNVPRVDVSPEVSDAELIIVLDSPKVARKPSVEISPKREIKEVVESSTEEEEKMPVEPRNLENQKISPLNDQHINGRQQLQINPQSLLPSTSSSTAPPLFLPSPVDVAQPKTPPMQTKKILEEPRDEPNGIQANGAALSQLSQDFDPDMARFSYREVLHFLQAVQSSWQQALVSIPQTTLRSSPLVRTFPQPFFDDSPQNPPLLPGVIIPNVIVGSQIIPASQLHVPVQPEIEIQQAQDTSLSQLQARKEAPAADADDIDVEH